jgi:hypothetical protein
VSEIEILKKELAEARRENETLKVCLSNTLFMYRAEMYRAEMSHSGTLPKINKLVKAGRV